MFKIGDKIIVRGTTKEGIITSERLVRSSSISVGNYGDIKLFTVTFGDGSKMEYEQNELRKQ